MQPDPTRTTSTARPVTVTAAAGSLLNVEMVNRTGKAVRA